MIFLKKMLEDTNTIAEPKAHIKPRALDAEVSNEHASITPRVKGRREKYVWAEYETLKRRA
jgi:hypothetical protein